MQPPPLSLYIHLPWCIRKCPYCDFNSHALRADIPEDRYVEALLRDLALDAEWVGARAVQTIFIGGGTPSLFSADSIARLLLGIRTAVNVAADAEITLEANPGATELTRFRGFRDAGINRLSIGIQSFDAANLKALGRIHGAVEAYGAVEAAYAAGFENVNLDLMYGLPSQGIDQALTDIATAIALHPTHLSAYQLTLEPNTLFYRQPPPLPDDETTAAMQEALSDRLTEAGYVQYEVSAYAQAGHACRHNRNYWEFGDYVGIGAGAHAKITRGDDIVRFSKARHPYDYMKLVGAEDARAEVRLIAPDDRAFEFMLNALRLREGVPAALFAARTGLPLEYIDETLSRARMKGLLERDATSFRPTTLGRRFLNDLVMLFLPANPKPKESTRQNNQ